MLLNFIPLESAESVKNSEFNFLENFLVTLSSAAQSAALRASF